MIYIENYGDPLKHGNLYLELIGKTLTVYTRSGATFSGVLCRDVGDRIMMIVTQRHRSNGDQLSVIIFKKQIVAIEMPVDS